MNVHVSNGVLG